MMANKIEVWGRSIQIGDAGLPAQITTQSKDILAGPMEMIADENEKSRDAMHRGIAVRSTAAIHSDFDSAIIANAGGD